MISPLLEDLFLLAVREILCRVLSPFPLDQIDVFLGLWFGHGCPLVAFDVRVEPPVRFVEIYFVRAGLVHKFRLGVE